MSICLFTLEIHMQMVRVSLPKIDKKKKELEILHTGQRKGGAYFFRFYPSIRDYVSLIIISTSIILILFSQFLELLHPRSSKWSPRMPCDQLSWTFERNILFLDFLFLVGTKAHCSWGTHHIVCTFCLYCICMHVFTSIQHFHGVCIFVNSPRIRENSCKFYKELPPLSPSSL